MSPPRWRDPCSVEYSNLGYLPHTEVHPFEKIGYQVISRLRLLLLYAKTSCYEIVFFSRYILYESVEVVAVIHRPPDVASSEFVWRGMMLQIAGLVAQLDFQKVRRGRDHLDASFLSRLEL